MSTDDLAHLPYLLDYISTVHVGWTGPPASSRDRTNVQGLVSISTGALLLLTVHKINATAHSILLS